MAIDKLEIQQTLVAAKIESVEGVDAAPSGTTDAIPTSVADISDEPTLIESNEFTGRPDAGDPRVGRVATPLRLQTQLRGSGDGGVAPIYRPLLLSCGLGETLNPRIPTAGTSDVTGTNAYTFTVDTGVETDWPTTDGALVGQPVELSVNPATPTIGVVRSYTMAGAIATVELMNAMAAPMDGTTEAVVLENVNYIPLDDLGLIPSVTVDRYRGGKRRKIVGVRGTLTLTLTCGEIGVIDYELRGTESLRDDIATPTIVAPTIQPGVWVNGLAKIDRTDAACQTFTLALGNTVVETCNPNRIQGVEPATATRRVVTGSIDPLDALIATRDLTAKLRTAGAASVLAALDLTAGVGNRFAVTVPTGIITGRSEQTRDDYAVEGVDFQASVQAQEIAALCMF